MNQFNLFLAFVAVTLMVISGPVARAWGRTTGILVQLVGIAVGIVYFYLRGKNRNQE